MPQRFNHILKGAVVASRWGLAPFCIGLMVALLIVMAQFFRELAHVVAALPAMGGSDVILAVLKLVDLVLIANLLVMLVDAGVGILLPRATGEAQQEIRDPIDLAALKLRFFGSISAIAAIDLLESYINIEQADKSGLVWEIAILLAFVISGVLLAVTERLSVERGKTGEE